MPAIAELLAKRAGVALDFVRDTAALVEREILEGEASLDKRVLIPCCNSTSPPGLVEAETRDPWQKSGKYALGWVYFAIILLVITTALHWYHYWNDKIRIASHKEVMEEFAKTASPATDYEHSALSTDRSTKKFFPKEGPIPEPRREQEDGPRSSFLVKNVLALFRYVFYRPIPNIKIHKRLRPIVFPTIGVIVLAFAALAFVLLYSFVPQPLYWSSIQFGSPPLAIRSGMLAVALLPWIIALSMKANFISLLTGIGHERLNVLHRWLAYIFMILSIIHTVPFYVTPVWDEGGLRVFQSLLKAQQSGVYIYGTGRQTAIFVLVTLANLTRNRCAGTYTAHLCTLLWTDSPTILRGFRSRSRACGDCPSGHDVLALSQLPILLEVLVRHNGDMAGFVRLPLSLYKLGEPLENVLLRWRGSCSDRASRECRQGNDTLSSPLETWSIRLFAYAWNLPVREPPIHDRFAMQR